MLWYFHRFSVFAWTGKNDSNTLRSGGSRRGPLFLDQTEARRAEKKFSVTPFPISPPHPTPTRLPLSKDLNPALLRVDAFFFFWKTEKKIYQKREVQISAYAWTGPNRKYRTLPLFTLGKVIMKRFYIFQKI